MGYSPDVYQKAINILERRREKATIENETRKNEISKKLPEINEIQSKLQSIGCSISELFFRGENIEQRVDELRRESLKLQKRKKEILVQNGYPEDALTIKYQCPACSDTGYIKNRMCNCQREILKEIERNSLRKIAPLDESKFENFDVRYYPDTIMENGLSPRIKAERILESCQIYAQSFNAHSPNLLFMGGTGLGKTHLSLAIANAAIGKGYSVVYGTSQNIISDLQSENFGKTENIYYNEYDVLNTDLLILDDLGTEYKTGYSVACLYNIINTRILTKRPTIISTNFDFDQLQNIYDQRITSRISGEYSILTLEGNDIRYIK